MQLMTNLSRLVVLGLVLSCMTTAPVFAGGLKLFRMSKSQELEIAKEMNAEYRKDPGLITSGKQFDLVQRIGKRLVERNKLDDYDYKFFLVKDDSINAFATPGGYIYVHKGLVDLMGYDEAMLAGVVAHEIGHATDRHVAKGYEKASTGGVAIGLLGALLGGKSKQKQDQAQLITNLLASAGSLMYLKYNRDQEEWADRYGVELTFGAGYDAYGMSRGLAALEAVYGSSRKVENFFESHPPNRARVERTERIAFELTGKPHGYMKVPQPPNSKHPLWPVYGPNGSARQKLGNAQPVLTEEQMAVSKQAIPPQR
jgi:predicted Zn-dependent protease